MTIEQIEKRIEQIKDELFIMHKKDKWTSEDLKKAEEMHREFEKLLEMRIAL